MSMSSTTAPPSSSGNWRASASAASGVATANATADRSSHSWLYELTIQPLSVVGKSQTWTIHACSGAVPAAAVKLVVHPLLVLAIGTSAIGAGVPLDRQALVVLVLVAALPSASNVAMLAERFGADNGRIARIILVSTAAAFLTFSAAVALLAPARPAAGA